MSREQKNKDGFTIVELLIVIVIIGILATVTIVAYNGVTKNAQTVVAKTDLHHIAQGMELYKVDNGTYPPYTNGAPVPELEKILRAANVYDVTRWSPSGAQASPTRSYIFCVPSDASSFAIVAVHPIAVPITVGSTITYISSKVTGPKTVVGPLVSGAIGLAVCRSLDATYLDRWSYDIPVTSV